MIELRHSKRQLLGITTDGQHRHRLTSSMQALQMREPEGEWQDINPQLVYSNGKWISQGTPYLIEHDANCGRRIYPDRTDKSKYLDIPAIPLFSTLSKTYENKKIVASHPDYDITFGLHNTRITFRILIRNPIAFDRVTFDVDSSGLDIVELLSSKTGIGISSPKLIGSNGEPDVRRLEWSYNAGQLELGFDLTGLKFPILLSNVTVDVDIAAGPDDDYRRLVTSTWNNNNPINAAGYYSSSYYKYGTSLRFTGVNIPAGATINTAYVTFVCGQATSGTPCNTRIGCEDSNNPGQVADAADHDSRYANRTTEITWDGIAAWSLGVSYQSPDIAAAVQEVVVNNGGTGNAMIVLWNDFEGRSSNSNSLRYYASYDNLTYDPANLEVDYDLPGGGSGGWAAGASRLLV